MRLAISNIAWDVSEDEAIAKLLQNSDIDAIDIAPGKYFPNPEKTSDVDIMAVKQWWKGYGIEITGMQALLFGTKGLNVFGDSTSQKSMLEHLESVCRIAQGVGATRLVFGSPKNRDRTGLSDKEALAVAISFFQRLGDVAQSYGVIICLEPNPVCYGANFMTTTLETATVVRAVAHPSIQMQFDTGALAINNEDPWQMIQEHGELIGHIHASEPDLLPLGDGNVSHSKMAEALWQSHVNHVVSIEMLATKQEPHMLSIKRALNIAIQHYRTQKNEAIL